MNDPIDRFLRRTLYWFSNERAISFLHWMTTFIGMSLGGVATLVLWFVAVLYSGVVVEVNTWEPFQTTTSYVAVEVVWVTQTLLSQAVSIFAPIAWLMVVVVPLEWLFWQRYGFVMEEVARRLSYAVFHVILSVVTVWSWIVFYVQSARWKVWWMLREARFTYFRWEAKRVLSGLPLPLTIIRIVAPKVVIPLLAVALTPIVWIGAGSISGVVWLALSVALAIVDSTNAYDNALRWRRLALG